MSNRIKLALTLLSFELVSWLILQLVPRNDIYFIVAGAFSFAIIPVIAKIGNDQLVIDILRLSILVLIAQFIGDVLYQFYFDSLFYNTVIKVLLSCQLARLFIKRKTDGVDQPHNFLHLLCRFNLKRDSDLC